MIRAVNAALALLDETPGGTTMDMQQLFDGFDPSEYEAEAEARRGETGAYRESAKRTKRYTAADWDALKAEQGAIYADAVAAMNDRRAAASTVAMDIAERHRQSINRWFYDCGVAFHVGLADMYEADERFAKNIDRFGEGLTPFLSAAIRANAARTSV